MNHADMSLGTWYPQGGMFSVVQGFYKLALEKGVKFHFDSEVTGFEYDNNQVVGVQTLKKNFDQLLNISLNLCHYTHTKNH